MALDLGTLRIKITVSSSKAERAVERLNKKIGRFSTAGRVVNGVLRAMGGQFMSAVSAMSSVGVAAQLAATAIAGVSYALQSVVKLTVEFEKTIIAGAVALKQFTVQGVQKMRDAVMELGGSSQFTNTEVAKSAKVWLQAGLSIDKFSEKAGSAALDLAAVAEVSPEDAMKTLTRTMKQFNLEADDLTRINDVMVSTFQSTRSTLSELAEGMKYVGAQASVSGVSLEETTATLGLLIDAGMQGGMAGRALSGALIGIQKPSERTKKILAGLNVDLKELQNKGFMGLVDSLHEAGIKGKDFAQIFEKRAARAMMLLSRIQLEPKLKGIAEQMQEVIQKGKGVAAMSRKVIESTAAGKWQIFISNIKNAAIAMGDKFLPEIKAALDWLIKLAKGSIGVAESMGLAVLQVILFAKGLVIVSSRIKDTIKEWTVLAKIAKTILTGGLNFFDNIDPFKLRQGVENDIVKLFGYIRDQAPKATDDLKAFEEAFAAMKVDFESGSQALKEALAQLNPEGGGLGGIDASIEAAKKLEEALKGVADAIQEINTLQDSEVKLNERMGPSLSRFRAGITGLEGLQASGGIDTDAGMVASNMLLKATGPLIPELIQMAESGEELEGIWALLVQDANRLHGALGDSLIGIIEYNYLAMQDEVKWRDKLTAALKRQENLKDNVDISSPFAAFESLGMSKELRLFANTLGEDSPIVHEAFKALASSGMEAAEIILRAAKKEAQDRDRAAKKQAKDLARQTRNAIKGFLAGFARFGQGALGGQLGSAVASALQPFLDSVAPGSGFLGQLLGDLFDSRAADTGNMVGNGIEQILKGFSRMFDPILRIIMPLVFVMTLVAESWGRNLAIWIEYTGVMEFMLRITKTLASGLAVFGYVVDAVALAVARTAQAIMNMVNSIFEGTFDTSEVDSIISELSNSMWNLQGTWDDIWNENFDSLRDETEARNEATESLREFNEELTNIPSGFKKLRQRQYEAQNPNRVLSESQSPYGAFPLTPDQIRRTSFLNGRRGSATARTSPLAPRP